MNKTTTIIALMVLLAPAAAFGSISSLELHGAGEFTYLGFIKVYDAELYVRTPFSAEEILDENTSKCLKLEYNVGLKAEDFRKSAVKILSRQHVPATLERVKSEIELLHNAYREVGDGDSYSLCYDAESQTTTLSLNQQELVSIASPEFAKIYFGIWLGENEPLDEELRNQLLTPAKTK